MAVMKVNCPGCDASIRRTIDEVDEPTEIPLTCPRCKLEFVSLAEPPAAAATATATAAAGKPKKSPRRDDDADEKPRSKNKKKAAATAAGMSTQMIAGVVAAAVLVIGGVVAAVLALGGKDNSKDVAKADPPAQTEPPKPQPQPQPQPTRPQPTVPTNPVPPTTTPGTGTVTPPARPEPKLPPLPPPPVIRISGSAVPQGTLNAIIEKPPAMPPLGPDEDPFERFKAYQREKPGPAPKLPPLPPPSQRPLLTLDSGGHSAFVLNVFISPDGKKVATVGEDKSVRLWDLQTGAVENTIRLPAGPGDEGSLKAAAMSVSGKTLAVAGVPVKSAQGRVPVFLIDLEKGNKIRSFSVATTAGADLVVNCLDFSGDGKKLAVGCNDGSIHWYNTATLARISGVPQAHLGGVREIRYQPQGNMIATIGTDGVVAAWEAATGKGRGKLDVFTLKPTTLDWTSNGQILAVGGLTGEIRMFDASNAALVRTLPAKRDNGRPVEIRRMQFLPDDNEIVQCGAGDGPQIGWVGVVDAKTGAAKKVFREHTNRVFAVNVSADGKRVVSSGGNENEVYVWSAETGQAVSRLCGTGKGMWGVAWAKDGKSIAWGTSNEFEPDGKRKLSGVFRLDDFGVGNAPANAVYQQAVKEDNGFLIQQFGQSDLALVAPGGQPALLQRPGDKIFSASLLPGHGIVVLGCARSLVGRDLRTGQEREFVGHTGNVLAVAPSPDGKYFVTGSSDQTIRVWVPGASDPVLSIFVAGKEWIAWTSYGYYACSPQGEQLIAWQVNSARAPALGTPTVHPAARFRSSLYQPALMKYVIPTGNLAMARAMAVKYDKSLVELRSIADVIPPEVALTDLGEDNPVIDKDTLVVKATATGKQPITAMRLLVDGRPFQGAAGVKKFAKPELTAEATWDVPLVPGPHTFAVVADTGVSKGMSRVATVTRSGDPPKPNLYVLTMGVSAYPGDMKLRYAASDARLLAETFQEKSKGLYENIEVRVLTDADATKKNMQDAMDWLKGKMTPKDVGIVSFSGHGTRDPLGRFYLIPVDVDPTDPAATCFSGEELKSRLENMPGRLVAILDACHSGAVAEKDRAQADGLVRDLVSEDSGVIVMCASLGREYAIESPLTKAGFYTLGLVEGMSGHGDIDQDGVVYINELDVYASARVSQLSGGIQNPTIGRPPSIRPFPIARP